MEPERLEQIERLFHAALEIEQDRQPDFLREACGTDESLRREVESLLAYRSRAEIFIELPAMELAARDLARDDVRQFQSTNSFFTDRDSGVGAERRLPVNVGRYRILRVLGEGGMGVVYEAEQEHPRRTVALKVINPVLSSPELLRRFEQESQALARLQHPAIAQIYEAGTADTGFGPRPFFAMEFVRGECLLDYADNHHLNTRQRLQLMVRICEGVHHAHQRGLIHRDLKPANILVDESEQPKILDFGVARVTDSDVATTRQTDLGQLVGTLAYMSPEQVLADPLELDTRSDVYALGVILYELLAGRLPYDVSAKPYEAAQIIREKDATPLSSISRVHRGDVETIVAKALEKDKARRYASVAGFSADIQRYLNDEPIAARPPSTTYQLQKFARRHRALVTGVAAVFVVLVAGIVTSTNELFRARRAEQTAIAERNRANNQSATAKAINDFLQNDLLAQAGAGAQAERNNKPDPDLKVRTALDRAAAGLERKFSARPVIEASIQQSIGNAYRELGLYPEAQKHFERALDLRSRVLGEKNLDTLNSLNDLALLHLNEGHYADAEQLFTKLVTVSRLVLGEENPDTLVSVNNLALLHLYEGKYAEAEPLYIKTVEIQRRIRGEQHPETLASMNNLAMSYLYEGKYAQAEPLYIRILEIRTRVQGEEHPDTLFSGNNLGACFLHGGRYAQAEPLLSKVLDIERRVLGQDHPNTLETMNNLASVYGSEGKYAQAEPLYTHMLQLQSHTLGSAHPKRLATMNRLAWVYLNQTKYKQAEALLRGGLSIQEKAQTENWERHYYQSLLGASLAGQKKYSEAEPLLLAGYQGMLQQKANIPAASQFRLKQVEDWISQLRRSQRKKDRPDNARSCTGPKSGSLAVRKL